MNTQKGFTSKKYDLLAHFYDWIWRHYTRQTIKKAIAIAELRDDEKVCDIGCGTGALEASLLKSFPLLSIDACDVSPGMVELAEEKLRRDRRINFRHGDFTSLEWKASTYDAVFSLSNFHYFVDPLTVLRKAREIAKPNGKLILLDWTHKGLKARLYESWMSRFDRGFQKIYTREEFQQALSATGWRLEKIEEFNVRRFWSLILIRSTAA